MRNPQQAKRARYIDPVRPTQGEYEAREHKKPYDPKPIYREFTHGITHRENRSAGRRLYGYALAILSKQSLPPTLSSPHIPHRKSRGDKGTLGTNTSIDKPPHTYRKAPSLFLSKRLTH